MAESIFENAVQLARNWSAIDVASLAPSGTDLLLAGPRMIYRLLPVPDSVEDLFGVKLGRSAIAEATGTIDNISTSPAGGTEAIQALQSATTEASSDFKARVTMESARSFSSIVAYTTSKWALGSLIMGVIISRIRIYGSTRRHVHLSWKTRFLVRMVPIILLFLQIKGLLQALQCQTSMESNEMLQLSNRNNVLHGFTKVLLLGASDMDSCLAVNMMTAEMPEPSDRIGSLSLLWPLFKTLGFSAFVQSLSCAIEGRSFYTDTGMSLFEHSLAFSEAESAIVTDLGRMFDGLRFLNSTGTFSDPSRAAHDATRLALNRSTLIKKLNTTPEMLLVVFLSASNHLSNHLLAVFNLQCRLRLLNTGIWGLAYLGIIIGSALRFSVDDPTDQSLLRFPTVYLVGFFPHVLVFCGIIVCSMIYCAALCLVALAIPRATEATGSSLAHHRRLSLWEKFLAAHENMQANVSLSNIHIEMHQDFFTALMKVGVTLITMGTEAVFLLEDRSVAVQHRTWLEEVRLRDFEELTSDLNHNIQGRVGWLAPTQAKRQNVDGRGVSGYAQEMKAQGATKLKGQGALRDNPSRWIVSVEFTLRIAKLLGWWSTSLCLKLLAKLGIRIRPSLLVWLSCTPVTSTQDTPGDSNASNHSNTRILSGKDDILLPQDDELDVEARLRQSLLRGEANLSTQDEDRIDQSMYDYWKNGGFFGGVDMSADYDGGAELDEDTTSVISSSTADHDEELESDDDNTPMSPETSIASIASIRKLYPQINIKYASIVLRKCRGDFEAACTMIDEKLKSNDGWADVPTPTPAFSDASREPSPLLDTPLTSDNLAQLLHPLTFEQRAEASALAAHLTSPTVLTRSAYTRQSNLQRARVLLPPSLAKMTSPRLTRDDEAQILEHIIVSKRIAKAPSHQSTAMEAGASGLGDGGPQCVICQSAPRVVILWPCRCLSLCDDCRVTLAMNNFDRCVCCRAEVTNFSRIYVP